MNLREAIQIGIQGLEYRIDCVQPLIDSPYLPEVKETLQSGTERDLEAIRVLKDELNNLQA